MDSLGLVKQYMDLVFSGEDMGRLRNFLSDDFTFEGPLYTFNSPNSYIQSLKTDPFMDVTYEIIELFENEPFICVMYKFSKLGVTIPMAQLFEIKDSKISNTLLIFDSGKLVSVAN